MISITRPVDEVNDDNNSDDQTRRTRTRRQLGRLLSLIDLLASFRTWKTSHEITSLINGRLEATYSQRTIQRDLDLLEVEGLAESQMECPFKRFSRTEVRTWRLLLDETERLQAAAIKHDCQPVVEPREPAKHCDETTATSPDDESVLSDGGFDDDAEGSQPISVYTLQYTTPGGRHLYLPESVDLETISHLARRLQASGKNPVVYRMEMNGPDVELEGVAVSMTELECELELEYSAGDDEASDGLDGGEQSRKPVIFNSAATEREASHV